MHVRCLRGRFPADRFDDVSKTLVDTQEQLAAEIRELPGLIDYYAGVNQESGMTMSVSVWDKAVHATALIDLPAAVESRAALAAAGVVWDDLDACDVTWWVQPA